MAGRSVVFDLLPENFPEDQSLAADGIRMGLSALFDFMTFGAIAIIFGLFSLHAAWQAGITLTVYCTVLDYTRDLNDTNAFGYTLGPIGQQTIPVLCAAITGLLVYRLMKGPRAVERLLLLSVWLCYLSGCARSFLHKDLLFPPDGVGRLDGIFAHHPSLLVVHSIFTVSALITTWYVLTRFRDAKEG